jgi:hypothetical protein
MTSQPRRFETIGLYTITTTYITETISLALEFSYSGSEGDVDDNDDGDYVVKEIFTS